MAYWQGTTICNHMQFKNNQEVVASIANLLHFALLIQPLFCYEKIASLAVFSFNETCFSSWEKWIVFYAYVMYSKTCSKFHRAGQCLEGLFLSLFYKNNICYILRWSCLVLCKFLKKIPSSDISSPSLLETLLINF